MNIKNKGFTLIETLIGLTLAGMATTGYLITQSKETRSKQIEQFVDEAYDIVRAVDHRIAVDGYDPVLWGQTNWSNEDEIVNNLIGKQLTSKYLNSCDGGEWDPVSNSEHETKLIGCNHWKGRKVDGEVISAELVNDTSGFIQNFNLYIQYPNKDDFSEKFMNLKKAMNEAELKINQELTGSHYIELISINTGSEITSRTCLSDFTDCSIKLSIDRNGGNEYLRVDGSNSIIGEHLTFIETKGQAPMKCIRWANTSRDGSGAWSMQPTEECGIGIYKNGTNPVMVDVVSDTGTFKNILLDQQCNVYAWNGSNVVDTGNKSPCGTMNDGSEIIQVVDNIQSKESEIGTLYAGIAHVNDIFISNVIATTIESEFAYIEKELRSDIIDSYTSNGTINFNANSKFNDDVDIIKDLVVRGETTLKDILRAEKDAYFSKNAYIAGNLNVTSNINANLDINSDLDITAQGSVISNDQLEINKINTVGSSCSTNGAISRTSAGELLSCVSGVWTSNTETSAPIGAVMMWASSTPPDGWIEMNGQSTAAYPKLRAIVGNNVPDLRGEFVRGWDHGRGADSGRSLKSYQADTMPTHFHGIGEFGGTGNDDGWFIYGNWSDGRTYNTRWIAGESGKTQPRTTNGNKSYAIKTAYDDPRHSGESRPRNIALMYVIKAE